jgi:Flp pilus assembly pilin Flp
VNIIIKILVGVRASPEGQTMTEYVLIIAAIAVAGYIAYSGLEGGINTVTTGVTTTLSAA